MYVQKSPSHWFWSKYRRDVLLTHVIERLRVDLNSSIALSRDSDDTVSRDPLVSWLCFLLGWLCMQTGFFSTRWQHGHQQLQAHILLALILADRDVSFLRAPLLGLSVTVPTWGMSPGRWKVLVMRVPPAPQRRERTESALPNHLDWVSGTRKSLRRGISASHQKSGSDDWAVQTTDCRSLLLKCYHPFTLMHKVVFRKNSSFHI